MYRANDHGNFPGHMYGEMSWNLPEGNLREILRGNVGEMSGNFLGRDGGFPGEICPEGKCLGNCLGVNFWEILRGVFAGKCLGDVSGEFVPGKMSRK